MKNRAVFLDRDGTINEDPGYLGNPDHIKLYPNAGKAIAMLKKRGFLIIVISNQSGIARGLITNEMVESVNEKINKLLSENGGSIDRFYYCPFHPEYNTEDECKCRKPSPALVFIAAEENSIDLTRSYFIGDTVSDIECGLQAGLVSILVLTGYGKDNLSILQKENKFPSFVAENIFDACSFILKDSSGD